MEECIWFAKDRTQADRLQDSVQKDRDGVGVNQKPSQ